MQKAMSDLGNSPVNNAKELLRRYKAGERDFRGASLRGAKLFAKNLRGALSVLHSHKLASAASFVAEERGAYSFNLVILLNHLSQQSPHQLRRQQYLVIQTT